MTTVMNRTPDRIKWLIAAVILGATVFVSIKHFILPEEKTTTSLPHLSVAHLADTEGTTMKEAIKIADGQAYKWSADAQLVSLTSADEANNSNIGSGGHGRRQTWNLFYTDTGSTHEFSIQVCKGKVADSQATEFGEKKPIKYADLNLDSDEAVAIAVREKGLKPGKDWAVGYHFVLDHQTFNGNGKEYLVLQVFGLSPGGNLAAVFIDESNKKIILAQEKINDEKDNAIWKPF